MFYIIKDENGNEILKTEDKAVFDSRYQQLVQEGRKVTTDTLHYIKG